MYFILVASDIFSVKTNFELSFPQRPAIIELTRSIGAAFTAEIAVRRPDGVPPHSFHLSKIKLYDEDRGKWVDLQNEFQLQDLCQCYAFQHENPWHRETQKEIPPAIRPPPLPPGVSFPTAPPSSNNNNKSKEAKLITIEKIEDIGPKCELWRATCPISQMEELRTVSSKYSPEFRVGGGNNDSSAVFRLHFQNRTDPMTKTQYLAIHLQFLGHTASGTFVHFNITVCNVNPEKSAKKTFHCNFKKSGSAWGLHHFIPLDSFSPNNNNRGFVDYGPDGLSPSLIIDVAACIVEPDDDGSYTLGCDIFKPSGMVMRPSVEDSSAKVDEANLFDENLNFLQKQRLPLKAPSAEGDDDEQQDDGGARLPSASAAGIQSLLSRLIQKQVEQEREIQRQNEFISRQGEEISALRREVSREREKSSIMFEMISAVKRQQHIPPYDAALKKYNNLVAGEWRK